MIFEWDEAKAASNLAKHGVAFDVAIALFDAAYAETPAATVKGEPRAKAVGFIAGRLFTIVFTRRGGVIRVISARRANASETRQFSNGAQP